MCWLQQDLNYKVPSDYFLGLIAVYGNLKGGHRQYVGWFVCPVPNLPERDG